MIRGGGDIASGVAIRLYRADLRIVITELSQPLAVRRLVCFSEAIINGETAVEGIVARRVEDFSRHEQIQEIINNGDIPVIIDPEAASASYLNPVVLIDGRMMKEPPLPLNYIPKLIIGLGPGFDAGHNCHAVVETNRGHTLGRVIWEGKPQADTGIPESIGNQRENRVLRAPSDGILRTFAEICDTIERGQMIAEVNGIPISANFSGVLRGILHNNIPVKKGQKIGDMDPRGEPEYCSLVSDKALAVGGGVLEAILTMAEIRDELWR